MNVTLLVLFCMAKKDRLRYPPLSPPRKGRRPKVSGIPPKAAGGRRVVTDKELRPYKQYKDRIPGLEAVGEFWSYSDSSVWAQINLGDSWRVAYRIIPQDDELVVGEIRVFPREGNWFKEPAPGEWSAKVLGRLAKVPPGGITARLLRQVKVGQHHEYANEFVKKFYPQIEDYLSAPRSSPKPRRKNRLSDVYLAALAGLYVAVLDTGVKQPIVELSRRLKRKREEIRDHLHQARNRKILAGGRQGRATGTLTEKAKELIASTVGSKFSGTPQQQEGGPKKRQAVRRK